MYIETHMNIHNNNKIQMMPDQIQSRQTLQTNGDASSSNPNSLNSLLAKAVLRVSRGSGRAPQHFTSSCPDRGRVGVPRPGFEQPCPNHGRIGGSGQDLAAVHALMHCLGGSFDL